MQTGFVNSNGVKLYYESEGEGEPLLCLNGGPGFSHEYLQELRALAPFAQLVFFDQRGTGKSDKVDAAQYTIRANVEDVENVRRALNLERVRVLGHSWGGMLAQEYVLAHPSHVTRLILADTFSSIDDCNAALARMRASVRPETRAVYDKYEREGLYKNRERYSKEYSTACDEAYAPVFIGGDAPDYLQDALSKIEPEVYRAMWGEETEFRVTGTLAQFDVEARLREIRLPTLVIVGAHDMPTVAMAEKTAHMIPHARLEVFEHSHHFPFIEEKERFVRVVRAFLQERV